MIKGEDVCVCVCVCLKLKVQKYADLLRGLHHILGKVHDATGADGRVVAVVYGEESGFVPREDPRTGDVTIP